jgi:hypothetical protein
METENRKKRHTHRDSNVNQQQTRVNQPWDIVQARKEWMFNGPDEYPAYRKQREKQQKQGGSISEIQDLHGFRIRMKE